MAKLIIEGVPPWDGAYDFSADFFTNRELHTIKKVTGIRAGELTDAIEAGDSDLVVALAIVVAERHGKTITPDELWDAQAGSIRMVFDDDQEAADPDPPAQKAGDAVTGDAEPTVTSGGPSTTTGDPHQNGQSRTGSPGSAITSTSALQTSET